MLLIWNLHSTIFLESAEDRTSIYSLSPDSILNHIVSIADYQRAIREYGGGDCFGRYKIFSSADKTIVLNSSNCGEYGNEESIYILESNEILFVKQRSREWRIELETDSASAEYIVNESVYDFIRKDQRAYWQRSFSENYDGAKVGIVSGFEHVEVDRNLLEQQLMREYEELLTFEDATELED